MENKGFMISNLINIFFMCMAGLGVSSGHMVLTIIFSLCIAVNAGYLLYKSNEINKQNEGQSHGKKS